jgi:hypothetical protein
LPQRSTVSFPAVLRSARRSERFAPLLSCAAMLLLLFIATRTLQFSASAQDPTPVFRGQTQEEADRKSAGCITCHIYSSGDEPTMHPSKGVHLGCTDCHGGLANISVPAGTASPSSEYAAAKEKAHVRPRDASLKDRSSLPERYNAKWLKESAEYVKFVNPGDLRVAPETCGTAGCHPSETRAVSNNLMTHSGLLWGAALYNNGGMPYKNARFGESYSRDGVPQRIRTSPLPTPEETRTKGVLPELTPLLRWETSQPGNVLRVFERGGEKKGEIGNPLSE